MARERPKKERSSKERSGKERLYKDLPRPRLTHAQIAEIYQRLSRDNPEPETELEYSNPFTLVVAVALSAQATDVGVNRATRALFARASTPAAMLALGEDTVREHIKTIGLFRNKAKNVIALSAMILERFGGEVPQTRDELVQLPGVGRKTANVVLNEAFGEPTMAVDTHIFRVANRTGMAPGPDPTTVELNLLRVTPDAFRHGAHHWVLLHGRYVCKARTPECYRCSIADLCRFRPKTPAP